MSKKVFRFGPISRRGLLATASAGAALAASPFGSNLLHAEQAPIKIGMSMPQTGGLAGGGKSSLLATASAGAALAASPFGSNLLHAEQAPIKIGMSMPQTGGLAGGGKSSLLGIEIWRDDVNAKGG